MLYSTVRKTLALVFFLSVGFLFAQSSSHSETFYRIPTNANLEISGDVTLEAWVRPNPGETNIGNVLMKGDNYGYGFGVMADGTIAFWQTGSQNAGPESTTSIPQDGSTWSHIAIVNDGGVGTTFYINGAAVGSNATGGSFQVRTGNLYIGAQSGGFNPFDGLIDEVRIWNDVRTSTEILTNYNQTLVGNEQGLAAYYRFNEGSGTTILDEVTATSYTPSQNSITWSTTDAGVSPLNYALDFDGSNDKVEIPASSDFGFGTADFTVEFWGNLENAGATYQHFLMHGADQSDFSWKVERTTQRIYIYGNSGAISSYAQAAAGGHYTPNQWNHFALVRRGGIAEFYVNGALLYTYDDVDFANYAFSASKIMTIGWGFSAEYTNGAFDEYRIWDSARSASQLLAFKDIELNGTEPNLVAYYNFSDGPGSSTLTDNSANSNNGTLISMDPATDWIVATHTVGDALPLDDTDPSVSITTSETNPTSATPFEITITFDEEVTGFADTDLTVVNGTASNLTTADNIIFTADITGIAEAPVTVDIAADAATDLTGNGNVAATQFSINYELPNYALAFDGVNDDVLLANDASIQFGVSESFTLEAWFKTNSAKGLLTIFDQRELTGQFIGYTLYLNSGQITTQLNGPTTNFYDLTGADLRDNVWHHVAIVVDRNSNLLSAYVDGLLYDAVQNISAVGDIQNSEPLHIGGHINDIAAAGMEGQIDEVRIWNVARSASQINTFKDVELNGNEPNLVAYHNFSDGPGSSTLTDNSANSNNGSLANMDPATDWIVATHTVDDALTLDVTSPTVSITTLETNPTSTTPFEITITFDEEVAGFTDTDLTVVNGTASNLTTADNIIFTADITGIAEAPVTVDIAASAATDITGNGNVAATQFSIDYELPNYALAFDGVNDYVEIPQLDLSSGNQFTVEAMIQADDITSLSNTAISRQQSGTAPDWLFGFQSNGDILSFGVNTGSLTQHQVTVTPATFTDGNWHHVAGVYDGSVMLIYVDGVQIGGTGSKTGNMNFGGTGKNIFGAYYFPPTMAYQEFFEGQIDELRIWSTARSLAEIQGSMNSELTGSESGLEAYYQMNEGTGVDLFDQATSSTTSSAINGAVWAGTGPSLGAPSSDTTAPIFTATPTATLINDNNATLTVQLDEIGTAHWGVYDQVNTPTAQDVKDGLGMGGINFGALSVPTANVDAIQLIETLSPSTSYFLYVATEDGSGNLGTPVEVTFTTAAAPENAINIPNVSDYLSIVDDASLDLVSTYTLEAWVKPSVSSLSGLRGIISKYATAASLGYFLRLNGGIVQFDELSASAPALTADEWVHLAATNDGGSRKLYINGVEVPLSGTPQTVVSNSDPLLIGSDFTDSNDRGFLGDIDEVRIWNIARTQAEIATNANNSLATLSSTIGLVSSFDFNQSSSTAIDAVSGNNGTINGGATYVASTALSTDITPPTFELGFPSISNLGADNFDLSVQLDEEVSIYYVVVPDGASAPTVAEVLAGTGNGGSGEVTSGSFTVPAIATTETENVTGLSSSTAYDLYVIAQDNEGSPNVQQTLTYIPGVVTTASSNFALEFDGNDAEADHVMVNTFALGSTEMTIEAWIKVDALKGGYMSIVDFTGDNPFFGFNGNDLVAYLGGDVATQDFTPYVGVWTHVAVTIANLEQKLFINGTEVAYALNGGGTLGPGGASFTGSSTSFGIAYDGTDASFDGSMDEVRIWNDIRTLAEISTNRGGALIGNEANLVAYYDFNQGSGSSLNDKTANGYNGILLNGNNSVPANGTTVGPIWTSDTPDNILDFTDNSDVIDNVTVSEDTDIVETEDLVLNANDFQVSEGANLDLDLNSNNLEITNSASFTNDGTVNVTNGTTINAASGTFTNNGTVNVQNGTGINASAGSFVNNGTFFFEVGSQLASPTGTFVNNGTIKGFATVTNDFVNPLEGTVAPGASPGCMDFVADFTNSGDLDIEIDGTIACTEYDQITVGATANLGGTLNVILNGAFTPTDGTQFVIIDATSISGTFGTVNLPDANWSIDYGTIATGEVILTYTEPVPFENALSFDGVDDVVVLPGGGGILFEGPFYQETSNFTIEFWFNTNSTNAVMFLNDDSGFNDKMRIQLDASGFVEFNINGGSGNSSTVLSSQSFNDGTWHHVAAVRDGTSSIKLYINGRLEDFDNTSNGGGINTRNNPEIGSPEFAGRIDEFRFWDRDLTQIEILNQMNQSLSTGTGLVASYDFNTGEPGGINTGLETLTDISGNGNIGTLQTFDLTGSSSNWVASDAYNSVIDQVTLTTALSTISNSGMSVTDGGFIQDAGDFVTFSYDNVSTDGAFVSDINTNVIDSRWEREWYVTSNDVNFNGGEIEVTFDFAALGLGTPTEKYALLYRETEAAQFQAVVFTYTISGNEVTFVGDGLNLSEGYYTIGQVTTQSSTRLYVNGNAFGTNDGSSWTNAFDDLQGALAVSGTDVDIWVAKGTYTPHVNDRSVSFAISQSDIEILGGFNGTETVATQRDPQLHITQLSGDLLGDDNGTILHTEPTRLDNSYHVVTIESTTAVALLDGFIIEGGNASEAFTAESGGGIFMDNSSMTISNCVISNNSALIDGAGIYTTGGNPNFVNLTVRDNHAGQFGGGIYATLNGFSVYNSFFDSNGAADSGGAIYSDFTTGTGVLANNVLAYNSALVDGGALYVNGENNAIHVINNTFYGNDAPMGGGIFLSFEVDGVYRNNIIAMSSSGRDVEDDSGGSADLNFNLIADGGTFGANDVSGAPVFVDANNRNFALATGSPAINAGSTIALLADVADLDEDADTAENLPVDFAGNDRVQNGAVDMGAFEFDGSGGSLPLDPTDLFAKEVSDTRIDVEWVDNSSDETGFKVERSEDRGVTYTEIVSLPADQNFFEDQSVISGTGYQYRVRALNAAGFSAYTNEEFAATFTAPHNALDFDGTDDQVDVSDDISLNFSGDFTIETWVNRTENIFDGQNRVILRKKISIDGADENLGYSIILMRPTHPYGDYALGMFLGDGINNENFYTNGYLLPLNSDVHVAFAYNSTTHTGQWYIDGQLQSTTKDSPANVTTIQSSEPLKIGGDSFGVTPAYFPGILDELRLWDDVRTQLEIQENQFSSLKGDEDNLVAYYKFDQGIADAANPGITNLSDRSINQNNGTLAGFALTAGSTSNWVASGAMASGTPLAPSDAFAVAIDQNSVLLQWLDNSTDENGFEIERSGNGSAFVSIATVGGNINDYVDNTVSPDNSYQYQVRAINGTNQSPYSNTTYASTLLRPGNVLTFDGDDYVEVPDNVLLEMAGGFTIEFWMKTTDIGNKIILEKGAANAEYSIQQSSSDKIIIQVGTTAIISEGSYNDGNWHHFAFVYRGAADGDIYVDGVRDVDSNNLGTPAYGATNLHIGSRGGSQGIIGEIDDIRIWDEARTAEDIKDRINGIDGDESNLLAYYKFDQPLGTILPDHSLTGGHHGTLLNGVSNTPVADGIANGPIWNTSGAIQPSNLFVEEISNTQIQLSWNDNLEDETDYILKRISNISGILSDVNLGPDVTSYTDNQATGEQIYYRLQADRSGTSTAFTPSKFGSTMTAPGNALNFDGADDIITIPHAATFDTDDQTIEGWFNFDDVGTIKYLAGKTSLAGIDGNYLLSINNSLATYSIVTDAGVQQVQGTNTLVVNQWYHIAGVKNGANIEIYVNGTQEGDLVYSGSFNPNASSSDFEIANGGAGTIADNHFDGFMDELRVWGNARNSFDISENRFSALNGDESGLVAYYKFDQGVDNIDNTGLDVLPDRSQNNNDGLLEGSFALIGTASNWTTSGAMTSTVAPTESASGAVTTRISENQIDLSWENGANNATSIEIQTSTDFFTGFTTIATLPASSTSFSHTGLTLGDGFFYKIVAVNSMGMTESPVTFGRTDAFSGYAVTLNGTDQYIDLSGVAPEFFVESNPTVEFWFNASSSQADPGEVALFFINNPIDEDAFGFMIGSGGTQDGLIHMIDFGVDVATGSTNILDDKWHHFAFTIDAGSLATVYIDGVLELSNTIVYGFATDDNWSLGQEFDTTYPTPSDFFTGSFDEFKWTSDNVKTDFSDRFDQDTSFPAVYYKMDENVGTKVTDISGNINADIIGGAGYVFSEAARPQAPSDLFTTEQGNSQITLTWTDNSTNETGFQIERGIDASFGGAEFFNVGANVTTFVDSGLGEDERYFYRVRGNSANGLGAYSNIKFGSTLTAPASALAFDGTDDYIIIPDNDDFSFGDAVTDVPFSIELWATFDVLNQTQVLVDRRGSVSTEHEYVLQLLSTNSIQFTLFDASVSGFLDIESSSFVPEIGEWYHIAVAYNGSSLDAGLSMYVDGVSTPVNRTNSSYTAMENISIPTEIGIDNALNPLSGQMDELRIWSSERTVGEIQSNMFNIIDGTDPNLVAYYRFDQTQPTDLLLPDRSANNNNGTWNGAVAGANSAPLWQESGAMPVYAPTDLFVEETSSSVLTLSWTDNSVNETGFLIDRYTEPDFTDTPTNFLAAINATSFTDNTVTNGVGYYYQVSALSAANNFTEPSNVKFGSTYALPHNALNFDGIDDHVVLPNVLSLDMAYTFETWFNPSTFTLTNPPGGRRRIVSLKDGINVMELTISEGNTLSFKQQSLPNFLTTETFNTHTWYHLALVYDGASFELYVNGVLQTLTSGGVSGLSDVNESSALGASLNPSSVDAAFEGQLDEVRIWNTARTVGEITSNIYNTMQGNESGLVAYYKFDQGIADANNATAITLYDRSINQNDGTLNGFDLDNAASNWVASEAMTTTPFEVFNTNDSGIGSLRQAILDANASSNETITFNIPASGSEPIIIGLTSALPLVIANGTIIDGTSQPGWVFADENTMVTIDATSVPSNNTGIRIDADDVEVYGLIITGTTGSVSSSPQNAAIVVNGGLNAKIGAPNAGNILHGNANSGIYVVGADNATIQGNWIGLDASGSLSSNNDHGIGAIGTVSNLTIGGDSGSSEGNVISGAGVARYGIQTTGNLTDLIVQGNLIGTDETGSVAIGNALGGINIGGTTTFTIGGIVPELGNLISGNDSGINSDGIVVNANSTGIISNNRIGTNGLGTAALGNGGNGVELSSNSNNVTVSENVISANGAIGVVMGGGSVSSHTISNNIIGLTSDGLSALGNIGFGINLVGTSASDISITGNTISSNGGNGIGVNGDQTNLLIENNKIGVNINGQGDMILDGDGVTVTSDNTFGNQANGIILNLVDGSSTGNIIRSNTISGNGLFADNNTGSTGHGLFINSPNEGFTIQDNIIGLEGDGITPQKNINSGIYISILTNSVIGGVNATESNLIGYNGDYGIEKTGTTTDNVDIHANEFICNEKGGISFTGTPDVEAPVILTATSAEISGTSTAEDGSEIILYEAEDGCNLDQGSLFIGQFPDAVLGGIWTISGSFDVGKSYVAVVVDDEITIDAVLSSSEFSASLVATSTIAIGNVLDNTDCSVPNGAIQLTGLLPSTTYDVNFDQDGSPNTIPGIDSDASGNIDLLALPPGSYTSIQVDLSGILSNVIPGPIDVLDNPDLPIISIVSVIITDEQGVGANGSIDISSAVTGGTTPYNIEWFAGESNDPGTIIGGEISPTIVGLSEGNYTVEVTDANGCIGVFETFTVNQVLAPEIEVTGLGNEIVSGDDIPDLVDDTDFGSVEVSQVVTKTYTINNLGTGDLNLGSDAVSISGDTSFEVGLQPDITVSVGGITTFTITFTPLVEGPFSGQITILNDDSDESPYTFDVTGTATLSPPVLSDLLLTADATLVDVELTVDSESDLYYVISTSDTPASEAQVLSGLDGDGNPGSNFGNFGGINATSNFTLGDPDFTGPELLPSTTYYIYWVAQNVNGNSAVLDDTFTTLEQINVTFSTETLTGTDVEVGTVDNLVYAFSLTADTETSFEGVIVEFDNAVFDPLTDLEGALPVTIWSNTTGSFEDTKTNIGSFGLGGDIDGRVLTGFESALLTSGTILSAGIPVYFYVTVNIAAGATESNQIKVIAGDIGNDLGLGDAVVNGTFDEGAFFNITTPITEPDATLTTISVDGVPLVTGSTDNLIYKFSIEASGGNITKQGMSIAIGGDAVATDFSANGWKLYESVNTDVSDPLTATEIGATNIGDLLPDSVGFIMSGEILDGDTHYYYLTVDVDPSATVNSTFNVVLHSPDPLEGIGIADPKNKIDNGFVDGNTFTIQSGDVTSPTVTLSSSASDPINTTFTVEITFDEDVVDFDVDDVAVTNGTKSDFSATDGANYTVNITPIADGIVTVDVADAVAQDAAGNDNTAATQFAITADQTSPAVTLSSVLSDPTSEPVIVVDVVFSESVTGLLAEAFTVSNGTASNLQGTGTTYTVDVTPDADGEVTVDVANAVAQDAAGNDNTSATQFSITSDQTLPTVVISSAAPNPTNTTFTVEITFDEDVVDFDVDDVAVNGTKSDFSATDGANYTVNITPIADGIVTVDIADAVAQDAAGNDNTAATQFAITADQTSPTVTLSSVLSDPTSEPVIVVDVVFSELVTGLLAEAFTVSNGTASNLQGTGTTYTVDITPDADGEVTVDLAAGVAQDAAGNDNTAATQFSITSDQTLPTVVISSAAPNPTNAPVISVDITFGGSVTGFEIEDITVTNGTTSNFTGSGTTYSVDITPSADGEVTVDIPAGVAQDGSGNDNTAATQFIITSDQTAPVVTVAISGTSKGSPSLSGTIDDENATINVEVNASSYTPTIAGNTWTIAEGTITPDLADGTYEVIATATDVAGNVGIDDTENELTISQTVVVLQASNITSSSFQVNWSEGESDVVGYELDVSVSGDFTTFVSGYEAKSLESTTTSEVVTDLDFQTAYFYRVRLVNSSGAQGDSNTGTATTIINQETEDDFAALATIYGETGGPSWSSQKSWLADRLQDWEDVTIDPTTQRVTGVDLSSNNLTGSFPLTPALDQLTTLNLSGNSLENLADLSELASLSNLDVSENALGFDDLEPVAGITTVVYANQASITFDDATGDPIEVRYTSDYSLSVTLGGSANSYQWFRKGNFKDEDEPTEKPIEESDEEFFVNGETNTILEINYYNMGEFRVEIINTLVPDLTINVDPQEVLAIADMTVEVRNSEGTLIPEIVDGYLMETTRLPKGFDTLEIARNVASTFTFPDVVLGNYLMAAESDPAQYIPTYFGEGEIVEWDKADTVFFRTDDAIQLQMTAKPEPPTGGDGTLDIVIEEDFGDDAGRIDARRRAARRKCGLRRKTGGGRTDEDADGFSLIAYGETDDNGEFQFGFLPAGTYRFFVEYPGIPLDDDSFVEFEVGEAGISDTDFKLEAFASEDGLEVTINVVLGVILDYFKDLAIYPNPANNELFIKYRHLKSRDVTAELVDLTGSTKWSQELSSGYNGDIEIDVREMEEGVYILYFYDRESRDENVVSYRIIIQH